MKIEQLIQDCNDKRDTNWYTNAFTVLINYYYNLLEKYGNNVNIQQINTMGQALNCIICGIKLIPSDMDVDNIYRSIDVTKNQVKSKVLRMASDFVCIFLKHWIECFNKYYTYKIIFKQ